MLSLVKFAVSSEVFNAGFTVHYSVLITFCSVVYSAVCRVQSAVQSAVLCIKHLCSSGGLPLQSCITLKVVTQALQTQKK